MRVLVVFLFVFMGLSLAEVPEIPDLDDFEAVKERCDAKGGPGTYEKLKSAREETVTCVKALIDFEKVKTEVEEAKKTGSMDEVFGKYCNKRPELRECVKKTTDAADPCMEESEKQAFNVTRNIIEKIGDFVCYNDGDRIAMFVAEGGVECIQSRSEQIKNCFNQTVKFNPTNFSPNSIPNLAFDKKKCDNMKTIQDCVVKDLEDHCEDSTPANIVDAMFRFVKKLACKDIKKRSISLSRHVRNALEKTRDQIRREMENKLIATCTKHGNNKSYQNLLSTFNDARLCLTHYRLFITPLSTYKEAIDNCTKPARKASEECLSDSEKYYPDFVLESIQNLMDFVYKNADKLSGAATNMELAQCLKTFGQQETQKQLLQCYNNYQDGGEIVSVPSRPEICLKIKEFDLCVKEIFKNNCIKDIKITTFVNDMFTALEAPCQEDTITTTEDEFQHEETISQ